MIRLAALQKALSGLIGLRPHYQPGRKQYAPDLLVSRSGIYLNDVHPLITAENLYQALPKLNSLSFPQYDATETYLRGALLTAGAQLYILDSTDTGVGPVVGAEWLKTDFISATLRNLIDSAASSVVNAIIQQKKVAGAKSVVGETRLYHGAGNINQRIIKTGRFCGFEIDVKQSRDLLVRITQLGLQADTPNPELEIYIYHTSQAKPVKVFAPGFTDSGTFSWAAAQDVFLALDSEAYGPGGSFIIGYYEDDVQGQIIDREQDWTNAVAVGVGCNACNPQEVLAFELWNQYLSFHPFTVEAANLNEERTLFNVNRVNYRYKSNFGLNVNISLECDITQYLVRHQSLLADAISKQAAINILQIFSNTTENNAIANKIKPMADFQLDNRDNFTNGLLKQLEKSLAALSIDVADDDSNSPCLPKGPEAKNRLTTGTSGYQGIDGASYYPGAGSGYWQ